MSGGSDWSRTLGARIREARIAANISQAVLAHRVSMNRSSISNIEAGRQEMGALALANFARALGVGMETLLRLDDLPPEPATPPVPHRVTVQQLFEVTCETCSEGQPIGAYFTRTEANEARADHIKDMQERES